MLSLFYRCWLALSLGIVVSQAVLAPEDLQLAIKYAPQWKFHPEEIYFPSTVDFFLSNVQALDANGRLVSASVCPSNLDSLPNQGSRLYLSTNIEAGKKGFLRGQKPSISSPKAYAFVARKDNNVIDLYYWLFTPFNQGKFTALGVIGDHVGDWEYMAVRTVNGVATEVDYHAHDNTGTGTVPWDKVPKDGEGGRPVGYVALGSHGFWASPGLHIYFNIPLIVTLEDWTGEGGVLWDIRNDLLVYDYPNTYTGPDAWLNYKGHWGNNGKKNCWWHLLAECQVKEGPLGPYRPEVLRHLQIMSGRLTHTLGIVSTNGKSTFTFYVDAPENSIVKHVVVQQQCQPLNVSDTRTASIADLVANITSTMPFVPGMRITVPVDACAEGSSVTSYALGYCKDDAHQDCTWGNARKLRAFSTNLSILDALDAQAIDVEDLDVWKYQL